MQKHSPIPQPNPRKVANLVLFASSEHVLGISKDLARGNISFSQFYLLSSLFTAGTHAKPESVRHELTMSEIARKMGHSTAAATGLVDRMEKLDYLERRHAPDDRRKIIVQITERGIELVTRIRSLLQTRITDAMNEDRTRSSLLSDILNDRALAQ